MQDECENNFSIDDLRDNINEVEVKGLTRSKIPHRLLKVMVYVYQNLIHFPCNKFEFETVVSAHFFRNLHRLLKVKTHLHHSHITGKIQGYVHDFCNWTVRENKTELSIIEHNLFGFDAFYFLKGYQASFWGTKDLSVGSNRLTSINYMNINGGEVKFIDTLKYYQTSLAGLTNTATVEEKNAVKKLCEEFFVQHEHFSQVWKFLGPCQKEKVLDIVSGGKGIIPYEMIIDMDSLDIKPVEEFCDKVQFFSELKMKRVNDEEYEHSKCLFKTLKMRNLSDMNNLYNFQDVALLCELAENRCQAMQEESGYNPRKCNSASTLSGCIEREMSKVIIALPTSNEYINLFEQTLTGGFSCVNTRLAFDTEILLPNNTSSADDAAVTKDQNYKICYDLKLDDDVEQQKYRVISKILKLDENNQYGFAMTKPMATGCIKDDYDLSWKTFNFLLESVTLDDPIGHLYVVDIELNFDRLTPKQKVYNEICPPIIEKKKVIDIYERSTHKLLEHYELINNKVKSYTPTKKAHATLFQKKCFPMYIEHLSIVIKRLGWRVTKIHKHISFEQQRFKKNFIIKNQMSRQQAKNNIEKDFYKLLNNSNFGYDCRNNLDNCQFIPIFDELQEVSYIKKYYNFFDPAVKSFVTADLIKQDIEQTYLDRLNKIEQDDPYYEAKKNAVDNERACDLDALETF